jgi:hypothetical protein
MISNVRMNEALDSLVIGMEESPAFAIAEAAVNNPSMK